MLHLVILGADSPSPEQSYGALLITGVITIVVALIGAWAGRGLRHRPAPPPPIDDDADDEYHNELIRRATAAETEVARLRTEVREKRHDLLDAGLKIAAYREFIIQVGYNPDTFEKHNRRRGDATETRRP